VEKCKIKNAKFKMEERRISGFSLFILHF